MAADCRDRPGRCAGFLEKGERRVTKTFANPLIKLTDAIDRAFRGFPGCIKQKLAKRLGIGGAVCADNLAPVVGEGHQCGIDPVHAGAGHESYI